MTARLYTRTFATAALISALAAGYAHPTQAAHAAPATAHAGVSSPLRPLATLSAPSNAPLPKTQLPRIGLPKLTGTLMSFKSLPKGVQLSMRASLAAAMRADGVRPNSKRAADDCTDNCGDPTTDPTSAQVGGTPGPVAGCVGYKSASIVTDIGLAGVYYVYFTTTVDCSKAPSIFAVAAQAGGRYYDWGGQVGQVAPTWGLYQQGRTTTYTIGQTVGSNYKVSIDYDFGAATAWDGTTTHTWVIQ